MTIMDAIEGIQINTVAENSWCRIERYRLQSTILWQTFYYHRYCHQNTALLVSCDKM